MLLLGAVPALLIATLTAGAWAWWLTSRRLRRIRQASRYGMDAQAALRRHPAGRARWPEQLRLEALPGPDVPAAQPTGPDDDPEFIRALERMIRGDGDGVAS